MWGKRKKKKEKKTCFSCKIIIVQFTGKIFSSILFVFFPLYVELFFSAKKFFFPTVAIFPPLFFLF